MAERVVELLEVVEVDQQQRELVLAARAVAVVVLEAVGEQAAAVARGRSAGRALASCLALGGERAQLATPAPRRSVASRMLRT